jgi:hypothetical protein
MNISGEPRYVISVAARMLGTQTHTLRYYEKIGIIEPSRSKGNIRLYSERDMARLRQDLRNRPRKHWLLLSSLFSSISIVSGMSSIFYWPCSCRSKVWLATY